MLWGKIVEERLNGGRSRTMRGQRRERPEKKFGLGWRRKGRGRQNEWGGKRGGSLYYRIEEMRRRKDGGGRKEKK